MMRLIVLSWLCGAGALLGRRQRRGYRARARRLRTLPQISNVVVVSGHRRRVNRVLYREDPTNSGDAVIA